MQILKCPKCGRSGGGLHFKSARPGTRPYPYVKHYKQKPYCSIDETNISKIEFRDLKLNDWKSILCYKDWHKIPGLASRYSNIDSYIHRSDIENIHEEFLNIMDQEMKWVKKCKIPGKEPIAFTHHGHIVQMPKIPHTIGDLLKLMKEMEILEKNNDDPEKVLYLRLFHNAIILAHNMAFTARHLVIRRAPLEEATIMHKIGKKKKIITAKQRLRILKRQTKEVLPLFDPMNRDEALATQFCGTKCPNPDCKSPYRTDLDPARIDSKCRCYACGKTGFEVEIRPDCPQCHSPFYDSAVREMIETSVDDGDRIFTHCIYCKEEVYFPKKHVEKFLDILLI